MNLFSKVKKGMLDSTKTLKEISSDVTEMTRLKVALAKEKEQLEEAYYNLGKVLFVAYGEEESLDPLPKLVQTALKEMQQSNMKIKEYELRIEALKGIVKCLQCGFEVEEDAKFCSNCGNKLTPIEDTRPEPAEDDAQEEKSESLEVEEEVEKTEETEGEEGVKPE